MREQGAREVIEAIPDNYYHSDLTSLKFNLKRQFERKFLQEEG